MAVPAKLCCPQLASNQDGQQRQEKEASEDSDDSSQRSFDEPTTQTEAMCPFDIRFSQRRARQVFRDSRPLSEAIGLIRVDSALKSESTDLRSLKAPFPPIQVIQWRCKMRDEATGRPLVDPATGGELIDAEDRWFSLDNRRLYCLQKAAAAYWPDRVMVEVVKLPPGLTRARQFKKFRTNDGGQTILMGSRGEDEKLDRWSWREAVGIHEDTEIQSRTQVQMRRRPRRNYEQEQEDRRNRNKDKGLHSASHEEMPTFSSDGVPWRGILLFVAVYITVRCVVKVFMASTTSAMSHLTVF